MEIGFLASVLLVDDQIFNDNGHRTQESVVDEELIEPDEAAITDIVDSRPPDPANNETSSEPLADLAEPHDVDAEPFIMALADRSISCSVIAPDTSSTLESKRIVALARTADVVVLDWAYLKRQGRSMRASDAAPFLKRILAQDKGEGGRLRAVLIYTQDPNLETIRKTLRGVIKQFYPVEKESIDAISAGPVHLRIVGKPGNASEDIEKFDGRKLGEWIPVFFQDCYKGLLPQLALRSLASVRRQAHLILARFPAALDPAFVSQTSVTDVPTASELARQLIVDEMSAALSLAHLEDFTDKLLPGMVDSFLDHPHDHYLVAKHKGKAVVTPRGEALKLLLGEHGRSPDSLRSVTSLALGGILSSSTSTGSREEDVKQAAMSTDQQFAGLTLYRRTYQNDRADHPDLILELGVVLERGSEYVLCVQPQCKSARIKGTVRFPFIPLVMLGDPDLLIPVEKEWMLVTPQANLESLVHVPFKPIAEARPIQSNWHSRRRRRIFTDASGFIWNYVGTLRPAQAARQAEYLSVAASQVGLDEAEWLRASRRK